MLVNLNGEFIAREHAAVPINDCGFLYGDTLFETLKAHGQKIRLQAEHLDRLEKAATLLKFPFPRIEIETAMHRMAQGLTHPVSRLRLTLSRGATDGFRYPDEKQAWFLLTAQEATEPSPEERAAGAICTITPNSRMNPLSHLPQMKGGNRLDCLYAAEHARQKGAREALFVDHQGQIIEGSSSNIFAIFSGRLITPPLNSLVLDGIMRHQVLRAAAELGMYMEEKNLSLKELDQAEEVFLTNSMIDLLPVSQINDIRIGRGDQWRTLLSTLRHRLET